MADADLIAHLYPYQDDHLLYLARNSLRSHPRCMPPRRDQQQATPQSRSSRESTGSREDGDDPDTLPYLEVRFSTAPRTSSGLIFGTDANCDVVLPNIMGMGISKRHFALTYKSHFADGCSRLIVQDLGSRHGTKVTYDGKGGQPRSNFDWIIDGFDPPNDTKELIVQLHKKLMFRIVVAHHDITSPAYANNVVYFHQGAANAQELLHGLGLQSGPDTERNTGTHTPGNQPILLSLGRVGQGGFGVVSRHWNVSTGEEFACKQPVKRGYDKSDWEKEINIMKGISHTNIVRLCFSRISPTPLLYLEFMALGNLENQHSKAHFSHEECMTILCQSTSALKYLHDRSDPVAHRDLKPENILVQHRDPDGLYIKLSDFGFAKKGDSLKTHCGTVTYCPPEVCANPSKRRYTKAVDIWSLGVVILRFAYALPYPGSGMGMGWCEKLVEEAQIWESEGLIDILQRMLVIDAKARISAADCWREASQLITSCQARSTTPTPASHATGYGQEPRPFPTGHGGEQQALRTFPHEHYLPRDIAGGHRDVPLPDLDWPSPSLDGYLDDGPDILSENQRFLRSNGPPPVSARFVSSLTGDMSSGTSVVDTSQHTDGGVNIAQWEEQHVPNHWTDSEQAVAAALVGLTRMVPAQPPGLAGSRRPEGSASEYRQRPANTPRPPLYAAGPTQVFAPLLNNPFSHPQTQAQSPVPASTLPPYADHWPSVQEGVHDRFLHIEPHFSDASAESPTDQAPNPFEYQAHPNQPGNVEQVPDNTISLPQPQTEAHAQAYAPGLLAPPPVSVLAVPARAPVTYWKLKCAGAKVMYRPDDDLINITQLIHALGYRKVLRWPRMESKIGNMERKFVNGKHVVGTYVPVANAESILRHLRLGTASLQELARQVAEYK